MVYIDFNAINSYLKLYNSTLPWNTKPREYAKYAEALHLKRYSFSSAIHRNLKSGIISMQRGLNSSSFLIKYSFYK